MLPCYLKSHTEATLCWCHLIWLIEKEKGSVHVGLCFDAVAQSLGKVTLTLSLCLSAPDSFSHSFSHSLFQCLSLFVSFIHHLFYINEDESIVTDTQKGTNLFCRKLETALALLFSPLCLFSTYFLQWVKDNHNCCKCCPVAKQRTVFIFLQTQLFFIPCSALAVQFLCVISVQFVFGRV